MVNVFECSTALEVLEKSLGRHRDGSAKIPGGPRRKLGELAVALKCHPTYVSQILKGRAALNHDQAIAFCEVAGFGLNETDHFFDLLGRDRAGSPSCRDHFDARIKRTLHRRSRLKGRLKTSQVLSQENEFLYFTSHLNSLVHAALHLKPGVDRAGLCKLLHLPEGSVAKALSLLETLKLAEARRECWFPLAHSLHLGADNPTTALFHSSWRLKTANRLQESPRSNEAIHYSSVFSVAKKDIEKLRSEILASLEKVRKTMLESPSEELIVFCCDFYRVP